MKKLLLLLLFIPFSLFAAPVEHGMVTGKDGSVSLHLMYRDANGKQVVSPQKDWVATARYQMQQDRFAGQANIFSRVQSGTTGAMSNGTMPAVVNQSVGKRAVFAAILDKAKTGGKMLGKGALRLGGGFLKFGLFSLAYDIVKDAIKGSKFFWNEERGDFVREKDDDTYVVIATSYYGDNIGYGSAKTSAEIDEVCRKMGDCKILGYVPSSKLIPTMDSYCASVTPPEFSEKFSVGWEGFCYKLGYTDTKHRVIYFRYVDYVPMSLDEFIEEGTPEAKTEPDKWVNVSEVQPTGEPKVMVTDGNVAQSNPYTDPRDGKTKQTRWDVVDGGKFKETEILRPDLKPNSPEAPKLEPITKTGTESPSKDDGKTDKPQASAPAALDLCKEHPDILACDIVPDKPKQVDPDFEIPKEEVPITFKPDNIFPDSGICPVPVQFQAFGQTFGFSMQPACDLAAMLRPMIIAFAWLVAAFFCVRTIRAG